jgi:hypothetical protein
LEGSRPCSAFRSGHETPASAPEIVYRHEQVKKKFAGYGQFGRLAECRAEDSGTPRALHEPGGVRETHWSESRTSFFLLERGEKEIGGDSAEDQSGVWEVDRVAADRRRLGTPEERDFIARRAALLRWAREKQKAEGRLKAKINYAR